MLRKMKAEHYIFLNFKQQSDTLNIGGCVSDFQSAIQCAGYNVRNQVLVLTGSVLFS